MSEQKIRVLIAKPGLDGHDRGAKIIESFAASPLRSIGVNAPDRMSLPLQDVKQPLRIHLSPREHERAAELLMQKRQQRRPLVLRSHDV